jgi:hypothetical protein
MMSGWISDDAGRFPVGITSPAATRVSRVGKMVR